MEKLKTNDESPDAIEKYHARPETPHQGPLANTEVDQVVITIKGKPEIVSLAPQSPLPMPAMNHTASQILNDHVGDVDNAVAFGNLAVSADSSGRLIARRFDKPDKILFACQLYDEAIVDLTVLKGKHEDVLAACFKTKVVMFLLRHDILEVATNRRPLSGILICAHVLDDCLWLGLEGTGKIDCLTLTDNDQCPILKDSGRSVALPPGIDKPIFELGPGGEMAVKNSGEHRLWLLEADGSQRWSRDFEHIVGFCFDPDGDTLAVCSGTRVWLLNSSSGYNDVSTPIYENRQYHPKTVLFIAKDCLLVGCYQCLVVLQEQSSGLWEAVTPVAWQVPGRINAICRQGAEVLGFHRNNIVSCYLGGRYQVEPVDQPNSGLCSLAFRGDVLEIGDASGQRKSLDLRALEMTVSPVRFRRDLLDDPLYPQWCKSMDFSGSPGIVLWDNEVELDSQAWPFHEKNLQCITVHPQGHLLALGTAHGTIHVHALDGNSLGGELLKITVPNREEPNDVKNLAFLNFGDREFLVAAQENGFIASYPLEFKSGKSDKITAGKPRIARIAYESEIQVIIRNTLLSVDGGFGLGVDNAKESYQFFRTQDLEPLRPSLTLDESCSGSLRWKDRCYFGNGSGEVFEYDENLQHQLRRQKICQGLVTDLAINPDGRLLAVAGQNDYCVHILDRSSFQKLIIIRVFKDEVMLFTPPNSEERLRGQDYGAMFNPTCPNPTQDKRLAWYYDQGDVIKSARGRRLNPEHPDDLKKIEAFIEELYGQIAVQNGNFGRSYIQSALKSAGQGAKQLSDGDGEQPPPPKALLLEQGKLKKRAQAGGTA